MREPLLLPVGQYLGAVHAGPGKPPRHHLVRVGWDTVALADGPEADIWSLAHGRPDLVGALPSTRSTLDALALTAGVRNAEPVVQRLMAAGALAEVWVGGPRGDRFAAGHRWHSLLTGLGTGPAGTTVGLLGAPPLRLLSPPVADVWTWAQLFPDLLTAATAMADATRDADESLREVLEALPELLSVRAGWLDVAPPGDP